jgi:hypothetical protein
VSRSGSGSAANVSESSTGCHGAITRHRHHAQVMSARTFANFINNALLLIASLMLLSLAAWSAFR